MDSENAKKILKCMASQRHAVIASNCLDRAPESATVGFAEKPNLELVFGTWTSTRKYQNIEHDNRVSFVIGFESGVLVQYEGTAHQIEHTEADVELYLIKKPSARKHMNDADQVWFRVKPTWIRYSDFGQEPHEIFEVNQFNDKGTLS